MSRSTLAGRIAVGGRLELLGVADGRPSIRWRWEPRLAWWPDGIPAGRRVGLASSRLPRGLDELPQLLRFVCASVADVVASQAWLVTVDSTAMSRIATRAGQRANARRLVGTVAPPLMTLDEWFTTRVLEYSPAPRDMCRLELSPPLDIPSTISLPTEIPAADRLLLAVCDQLDVVSLRPGGCWQRLLESDRTSSARFGAGGEPTHDDLPPVRMAADESLISRRLLDRLAGPRIMMWAAPSTDREFLARPGQASTPVDSLRQSAVTGIDGAKRLAALGAYLIHTTRRCDGPWLGQSHDEYLDELLDERPERDRSPLAVLRRILVEQKIQASNRAIRGGSEVVCLADLRLEELPDRRVWRRHRRRWDFEPYGLAVSRVWLAARGARPVIYGDPLDWERLSDSDRPYFQRSDSRGRPQKSRVGDGLDGSSSESKLSWRTEREWRLVGDVDLRGVPDNAAVVFVPNEQSARWLAPVCRFPMLVLSDSA